MILAPRPQEKGVQPVYTGHSVFPSRTATVEVVVTYDVQGNGGMKMADKRSTINVLPVAGKPATNNPSLVNAPWVTI